ncbi:MAG: MBL fold metallo-hydrolase [Microthrixaceae bacterium]
MLQRHMRIEDLDAVLVSHSHPDHWVEVPIMRNALRYVLGRSGVPLHSTAETLGLMERITHDGIAPTLEPHVIADGSEIEVGPLRIRCSRTDHPPETLAFCVDDGRSRVAYSADTGPRWSFSEFGAPVDLGVCEATFRDGAPSRARGGAVAGRHPHDGAAGGCDGRGGRRARQPGADPPPAGADAAGAAAEAASAYGAEPAVARSGMVLDI